MDSICLAVLRPQRRVEGIALDGFVVDASRDSLRAPGTLVASHWVIALGRSAARKQNQKRQMPPHQTAHLSRLGKGILKTSLPDLPGMRPAAMRADQGYLLRRHLLERCLFGFDSGGDILVGDRTGKDNLRHEPLLEKAVPNPAPALSGCLLCVTWAW